VPSEHLLHGLSDLADGAAISGTDDGQAKLKSIRRHQFFFISVLLFQWRTPQPGNTNRGGRLSTIDLLIEVACFVNIENIIFNFKMS
jgi:hypothetical protein